MSLYSHSCTCLTGKSFSCVDSLHLILSCSILYHWDHIPNNCTLASFQWLRRVTGAEVLAVFSNCTFHYKWHIIPVLKFYHIWGIPLYLKQMEHSSWCGNKQEPQSAYRNHCKQLPQVYFLPKLMVARRDDALCVQEQTVCRHSTEYVSNKDAYF